MLFCFPPCCSTLTLATAKEVFKFLKDYKPETKTEKRQRLKAEAETIAAGGTVQTEKPYVLKFGLNHVTTLIEQKKAQLVLIAHDVDPIEVRLPLMDSPSDSPLADPPFPLPSVPRRTATPVPPLPPSEAVPLCAADDPRPTVSRALLCEG